MGIATLFERAYLDGIIEDQPSRQANQKPDPLPAQPLKEMKATLAHANAAFVNFKHGDMSIRCEA